MFSTGPGGDAVKLSGGLPGTASFLYNAPNGDLIVEMYDFGEQAQSSFGNDVAFLLRIAAADKVRMLALLPKARNRSSEHEEPDLIGLLRQQFEDYYTAKKWLDAKGIPYRKEFDSWA